MNVRNYQKELDKLINYIKNLKIKNQLMQETSE